MDEAKKEELLLIEQLRNNLGDMQIPKHHLKTRNLLRFLRARNGSVKNAEGMFRQQIEWREDNMIDSILEWEPPKEYRSTYWPYAISGFDEDGNPIGVIPVGLWDPTKVSDRYENFLKHCYQGIECGWQLLKVKSQSQKVFKQFVVIIDLKGLSFGAVTTYIAMHGVVEAVRRFEANYPEILKRAFIVNLPWSWVFEIGYRFIKPFVSDHTYSKLRFLGGEEEEWKEELRKSMPVDQFWEKYGGNVPDSYDIFGSTIGRMRKEAKHGNYNEFTNERMKDEEKVV